MWYSYWLEQLIAESTGKNGKGVVPISDETLMNTEFYANDRVFVLFLLEGDEDKSLKDRFIELEKAGHPVIHVKLLEKIDRIESMYKKENDVPQFFWDILTEQRKSLINLKNIYTMEEISPLLLEKS